MTLVQRLISEFARVYGCNPKEDIDLVFDFSPDGAACVLVSDWTDSHTYHIMAALAVLGAYKDGAASSPAGDRTVREDLGQQGALIGEYGESVLLSRYKARESLQAN
jgi:hypothetical protein